eukprot:3084172-Pleurochrysis_carterae.AAC.1
MPENDQNKRAITNYSSINVSAGTTMSPSKIAHVRIGAAHAHAAARGHTCEYAPSSARVPLASVPVRRSHLGVGKRMHRAKLRGAAAAARRRALAVQPAGHGDANLLAVLTPRSTVPRHILLHIEGCAVET